MHRVLPVDSSACSARPRRLQLARGLVVAALAAPAAAQPPGLDELLRMPLECLLQLQVAPRHATLSTLPDSAGDPSVARRLGAL